MVGSRWKLYRRTVLWQYHSQVDNCIQYTKRVLITSNMRVFPAVGCNSTAPNLNNNLHVITP